MAHDGALTFWLASLILSLKYLLNFNFVSTLIPINFSYSSLFYFLNSYSCNYIIHFIFKKVAFTKVCFHLLIRETFETCSNDKMTSSIAFAAPLGVLSSA